MRYLSQTIHHDDFDGQTHDVTAFKKRPSVLDAVHICILLEQASCLVLHC